MPKDMQTHYARLAQWLEWQAENKPRTPTVRELKVLWGLASENTVYNTLRILEAEGRVQSFPRGKFKGYYAVEVETEEK